MNLKYPLGTIGLVSDPGDFDVEVVLSDVVTYGDMSFYVMTATPEEQQHLNEQIEPGLNGGNPYYDLLPFDEVDRLELISVPQM